MRSMSGYTKGHAPPVVPFDRPMKQTLLVVLAIISILLTSVMVQMWADEMPRNALDAFDKGEPYD